MSQEKESKKFDRQEEEDYSSNEEITVEDLSNEDSLKKLRVKLQKCVSEKQEYLDGWARSKADFINHKKGEEERHINTLKFAKEDFILDILPVLDSFDMARKSSKDSGIEQIFKQFLQVLEGNGLEEVKAEGKDFNPNEHEAIEMVDGPEGRVVEVLVKGYKLNKKIIRPAKVKVGK